MNNHYNIKIYNSNTGELLYNQTINIDSNKFITLSTISESGKLDLIVLEDYTQNQRNHINQSVNDFIVKAIDRYGSDQTGLIKAFIVDEDDLGTIKGNNNQSLIPERSNNRAFIRVVHLSSNTPPVDTTLPDETILFVDTKYKQVTDYKQTSIATNTLQLRATGTNQVLLTVPNLSLMPNKYYTLYVIGINNGIPRLEGILLRDGL